ncbi:MAG TPA: DUF6178 family protein, partial [Thermodesulfobacteriota bacterium]|nr:DUF6178 family protein [Thermodesulfobacteriota bacterium]
MDKAEERNQPPGAEEDSAPVRSLLSPSRLPEDPQEAEVVFNSLPVKNQLDLLLRARGKERLRILFLSRNPEQLVQQLPELDVFLTVKEVGEKDALSLISLTTPEQFQFLLDLDSWKKDGLNPEKILRWLEILLECGERKIAQFIQSADTELIALLLKKFLHVTLMEGEPLEAEEKTTPFTLDQYYFVRFKGKGTREILEPFLKIFSLIHAEGYRKIMEVLISEMESELEETGYRFRSARLAEYGFPDFEEALEIYRFIHPDSLSIKREGPSIVRPSENEKPRTTFYLTFLSESPFFSSVFGKIEDPLEQDRLKAEMAVLCNRAIVAEAIDLSNLEEIERITKRVFHYLNMGLEYLSREEEFRASEILQSLPLQKLFQCGVSLTLLLKKKAENLFNGPWFGGEKVNLLFLDPPYLERFEGTLKKRPGLHRSGKIGDFENLQEVKETENLVENVAVVIQFLEKQLSLSPRYLKNLDLKGCHPEDWREITLSTLFLTALANQVLKGSFRFEPLMKTDLNGLFSHLLERDEQGKRVIK